MNNSNGKKTATKQDSGNSLFETVRYFHGICKCGTMESNFNDPT